MSITDILFNSRFLLACTSYAVLIVAGLALLEWIIHRPRHRILITTTERVIEPLYRAFVLVVFIFMAYPLIYGLEEAIPVMDLLADGEYRADQLVNLVFLTSLILPVFPVIGKHIELILPVQAIVCCMMVFNWLAQHRQITAFSYWPGLDVVMVIALLAVISHWLAVNIAKNTGSHLDEHFNVTGFEDLISQSIILFMQAPAILVYSLGLGRQLT